MIKFFRKIRYNLMETGKTGRYFKYAIGEIILVVIGILIAVGINSLYNNAQNEKKIKTILQQVQSELITDIQDAKRIFNRYIDHDSIFRKVMLDSSLLKMHEEKPFSFVITNSYVSFSNNKGGYDRLMSNLENLPDDYQILLPYFTNMYVELQNDIDDYNLFIKDIVMTNLVYEFKTEPKFSDYFLNINPEETLNYTLNDPFLKNRTTQYFNALQNIQQVANDYRIESIELYKKIDSLLQVQSDVFPHELKTTPDKSWITPFLGVYKEVNTVNDTDEVLELSMNNNRLLIDKETQLYWHEGSYFFIKLSYNVVRLYTDNNDNYFIEISNGPIQLLYKKVDP